MMTRIQCGTVFKTICGPIGCSSYNYVCVICSIEFKNSTEFEGHEICHSDADLEPMLPPIDTDRKENTIIADERVIDAEYPQGISTFVESEEAEPEVFPKLKRPKKKAEPKDTKSKTVIPTESSGRIKCICCKTYFACNGLKRQHIFMQREDELMDLRKFCDKCPANYATEDELVRHVKVHSIQDSVICSHCDEVFPTEDTLLVHIFVAEDSLAGRGINFSEPDELDARTRKIIKNRILESQRKYKCDICYCRFVKKHNLEKHMIKHSERLSRSFSCEVCGLEFKLVGNLNAHLRKHQDGKPFHCTICGKNFAWSYKTDHMRFHQTEKTFHCSLCDAKFYVANHLRTHMKRHQNVKSHKCMICERTFFFLSALKDHLRSEHTGERPFRCDTCGSTFARRKSLREHSRLHGEKKYKCRFCDLLFAQTSGRRGHEKNIHKAAPMAGRARK